MRKLLLAALFCLSLASVGYGQTTALSCNDHGGSSPGGNDVQSAISATAAGGTVIIPGGTCTWTTGVTDNAGHTITGAGSPRIIARDNGTDLITIGTGSKTFHIAFYTTGFSASSITVGETLLIYALAADTSASTTPQFSMQGTVTSITPGTQTCLIKAGQNIPANTPCSDTLIMSIASTVGTGTFHRWEIATVISGGTTIVNSSLTNALFTLTENTTYHEKVGNIHIVPGTIQQRMFALNYTTNGQAMLFHDMWLRGDAISLPVGMNGDSTMIEGDTTRGVIWNVDFESSQFDISTMAANVVKDNSNFIGAWAAPSYWGALDASGQNNMYCESDSFHAMGSTCDGDDNARMVSRYNFYDNSSIESHGADTSHIGQRTVEIYDNMFLKDVYNSPTGGGEFNLPEFFFVRGGSYAFHDNYIPVYTSTTYGTMTNVLMAVLNLQRASGQAPCWGYSDSAIPNRNFWYAPRQVGIGRVSGTGTTNFPPDGCTNCSVDPVYGIYVGDPEPAYIWNNNNSSSALSSVGFNDYGAPILALSGGGGSGALGKVTGYTQGTGAITGIALINGGSGYTTAPACSITVGYGGSASSATCTAAISGGAVSSLTLTAAGTTFKSPSLCVNHVFDRSSDYIHAGTDYFNNGTPKPTYSDYTYPHPLAGGTSPVVIIFAPSSVNFGSSNVGVPVNSTITISNSVASPSAITITAISPSGTNGSDFTWTPLTCSALPITINVNTSCNIQATFTPGGTGARSGQLNFTDNASGSPQAVTLSGTGTSAGAPAVQFTPSSLPFPPTGLGSYNGQVNVVLKNVGTATLTISSLILQQTGSDFQAATSCAASLSANATCTIGVTFRPQATGSNPRTATIILVDNASGSPHTVAISGNAVAQPIPMISVQ